ncbi:disease resistance protein Roq1-like [Lycium ferocissimum]|uniref:disease resistance protein Roq1-like n=1 Tax=Lycium ferocissimum TaxID=112874 RepID=UPI0028150667|nr:disease resistance protein Roq1-like [Lycium ferocissimum]XP_059307932.1 disease resistance protein Roq1-like [Lycium ferocissimum]XP_059307933.1 disease resistance protein Roq1-like [Lycium ferocissimum]
MTQRSSDKNEAKVIQEIVKVVEREVTIIKSTEIMHLRAVEFHMKRLGCLRIGFDENVRVIGMWGAPRTGKTATAKAIFDMFSHHFEGAVFLPTIGEVTKEHDLVYLQNDLIKETFNYHVQANDIFEGTTLIREKLQSKKVLVVLDGVDHVNQIRALAGYHDWFGKGSRIFVTTRDKNVLLQHKMDAIYEVKLQVRNEALQLLHRVTKLAEENTGVHIFSILAREFILLQVRLFLVEFLWRIVHDNFS